MTAGLAYCKLGVAPVRAEASDRSEIVTQLLFGEVLEVIGRDEQWMHIRTYSDSYEGWIDSKQVVALSQKEVNRWQDGLSIETALVRHIETPWGPQWITRGAFVPLDNSGAFNIGRDDFRFLDAPQKAPATVTEFALSYANAPYLWGGKTPFGIDCSGLMQITHRYFGMNLPRDASQQAEYGQDIAFEDRERGDLVFFQNKSGRIHHVGLLVDRTSIVHASGWVRVDDLTEEGILRRIDQELSHIFYSIKRL